MILADTSVWIDHLRGRPVLLAAALDAGEIAMHPLIIGELACGHLRNRDSLISLWQDLPQVPSATDAEALGFIDRHRLMARGLGYVDIRLLASAALGGARLWTLDRKLESEARRLGLV